MNQPHTDPDCPLCQQSGGILLWQSYFVRVVRVDDPVYARYPGYCRVILQCHSKEMSDLPPEQREHLMRIVFVVEWILREQYQPDKINLAAFGNQVPHIHWHIIPRFQDDPHYPHPCWGSPQREGAVRAAVPDAVLRKLLQTALKTLA